MSCFFITLRDYRVHAQLQLNSSYIAAVRAIHSACSEIQQFQFAGQIFGTAISLVRYLINNLIKMVVYTF